MSCGCAEVEATNDDEAPRERGSGVRGSGDACPLLAGEGLKPRGSVAYGELGWAGIASAQASRRARAVAWSR